MAKEKAKAKDSKVKSGTAKELKTKSSDELKANVRELKKETLNLRFQQASGQLKNTARIRTVKREIARSKTLLTQQATAAEGKAESKAKKK